MTAPTTVISGRIAKPVLLAAHQTCRDMGVTPKSHWQAVRTALEILLRKLQPEMFTTDAINNWSSSDEELLKNYGTVRGAILMDPTALSRAETLLEEKLNDQTYIHGEED